MSCVPALIVRTRARDRAFRVVHPFTQGHAQQPTAMKATASALVAALSQKIGEEGREGSRDLDESCSVVAEQIVHARAPFYEWPNKQE